MAAFRSVLAIALAVLLMLAGVGFNSRTRAAETVHLASGSVISLATPNALAQHWNGDLDPGDAPASLNGSPI